RTTDFYKSWSIDFFLNPEKLFLLQIDHQQIFQNADIGFCPMLCFDWWQYSVVPTFEIIQQPFYPIHFLNHLIWVEKRFSPLRRKRQNDRNPPEADALKMNCKSSH